MESKIEIAEFLKRFKSLAQENLYVIPRAINQQALIDLGLTFTDRRNIILSLSVDEYSTGPLADEDRPGFIWEFGKTINGVEIYIKLKIAEYLPKGELTKKVQALCLSFHKSKKPLSYPLKSQSLEN